MPMGKTTSASCTPRCTIAKVYRQCPSKQPQIDAVASAQSILQNMVMLLDDMSYVAIECEKRARAQALRASLLELDIEVPASRDQY
jgi:hypothetical protein